MAGEIWIERIWLQLQLDWENQYYNLLAFSQNSETQPDDSVEWQNGKLILSNGKKKKQCVKLKA